MVRGQECLILVAEDDDDDYLLTEQALKEEHLLNPIRRVVDGLDLMQYLRHQGAYAEADASLPALILLDLNMPRMDGREALREIKSDQQLRRCPVVVLTTSRADEDIVRSHELGVNSFITKPVTFQGLVEAVRLLGRYWFELVELPS